MARYPQRVVIFIEQNKLENWMKTFNKILKNTTMLSKYYPLKEDIKSFPEIPNIRILGYYSIIQYRVTSLKNS